MNDYTISTNTIPTYSIADSLITIDGQGNIGNISNTTFNADTASVSINGELKVNGDLSIKGSEPLNIRIDRIEKVLSIPTRNIDMEEKYPRLKEIWAEYNRELEKYLTWDTLKK